MPLKNYGVLVGRAVDRRLATTSNPHYQVHLVDDDLDYRIAVNVRSKTAPSEVAFLVDDRFIHPVLDHLTSLKAGFHTLPRTPQGGGLDYIRANLFDWRQMRPLPMDAPGEDNDLNEKINHYVQRALADETATLYAFGERWGPEAQKDKIFGFKPNQGIHDIHMNQGNPRDGQFRRRQRGLAGRRAHDPLPRPAAVGGGLSEVPVPGSAHGRSDGASHHAAGADRAG